MKKFFFALTCLLFLNSLQSNAQNKWIKKGIAPNFSNFKGVLLVDKSTYKLIAIKLENVFKKVYKGQIELILDNDLRKDTYSNKQTYPFVISVVSDGTFQGSSYFKMVMTDRSTGKDYETGSFPDNTIPPYSFIKKYAKALEKIRNQ